MGDSVVVAAGFPDSWLWLIFVGVGFLCVLASVAAGFDLLFIGSIFIIGGLVTWPFHSAVVTVIVTSVVCIAYVAIGRRYVHRWTAVKKEKSNIDAIIGREGIVLKSIAKNFDGRVRVGNERWRARAEEDIKEGDEIMVTSVSGSTLIVEKTKGGN